MLKIDQFREYVVRPSLELVNLWSDAAEELLVFTCACESNGGTYLHQVGGVAVGIYQMEPATAHDIWVNYIAYRKDLAAAINFKLGYAYEPPAARMITDWQYATVMARIKYLRIPEALPAKDDLDGIWSYYKRYYNTHLGKAEKTASLNKYWLFLDG